MSNERPLTLMTAHAHPDDESIGTGGVMAKAIDEGRHVVLVTCTRGEMGEIVVPEMDTPENHRRLGELRAVELERAMEILGVTEWHNLGYHDSDMMGRVGNLDPRNFWKANIDEAAGRLVWLIRRTRPHVMTTYNAFGGYGHPDHIRTHDVAVRAFDRAGDPTWYPEQITPAFGGTGPAEEEGGLAPWTPLKLYEQAIPASVRMAMARMLKEMGGTSPFLAPENATEEELAVFAARMEKMLVPDELVTTWVDVAAQIERKWNAVLAHITQIGPDSTFMQFGLDGWRTFWAREAYILRESRIPVTTPESDLFAGIG